MFDYIKGTISEINDQSVTISIGNIGIGVNLFVPNAQTILKNKELFFYTYMHWNQENGPTLYGFSTENERKIFLLVISCSGIGPKIGLTLVSQMQPSEFLKAIHEQDVKTLSSINGIGPKKAEQIIVSLKHKVADMLKEGSIIDQENSILFKNLKNISEALNSLSYSRSEINSALDYIKNNNKNEISFDQMLRQALSYLSKRI